MAAQKSWSTMCSKIRLHRATVRDICGALKSLTRELINDVDILNGPFSAEYGDFWGLGVVHIRLKEKLLDLPTLRGQGGSFDAYRGLAIYSPGLEKADAFIAYDGSHTDGPFINPGRYKRHILTGNGTISLTVPRLCPTGLDWTIPNVTERNVPFL